MFPFVQGRDGNPSNSSANTIGSAVEWDVIVVNDRKRMNAWASPGTSSPSFRTSFDVEKIHQA
jgi:hypothetical protein